MANEISKIKDAAESQLRKTDEVIASHEAVADLISEVNNTLASGFTMLGAGLQELCFITEEGFQEIIDRLELQTKTLEAIKEILERPLDTQAKELRKRAEVAYLNNWINEAEIDLLEAEKKNYQDFIVHQILGNIYYHHKKNYPKAIEYYQKAAKYAAPVSKKHANNALICAAIVYYQLGQVSDAYKSTGAALELSPEDPHVLYHHARYTAKIGYEFTGLLKNCVYKDPNYLITADRDEMFSDVKEKIKELAQNLSDEEKKVVDNKIKVINSAKKEAESVGIYNFSFLDEQLTEVKKLYARNSYLDLLRAEQIAEIAYKESVVEWMKNKEAILDELKLRENTIKNKTYAGWGFLIAIVVGVLAGLIIGNSPLGKPERVGPTKILTFTSNGWVKLGDTRYTVKPGDSVQVLSDSQDSICLRIKHDEGCLSRIRVLQMAKLEIGYFSNYSKTLSGGALFFWIFGIPIVIWILSTFVIKSLKVDNISNLIKKIKNDIAGLSNL